MIAAPAGSKGAEGPKSTTNPVFLDMLFHVMVVPVFTQKGIFDFAPGISGVTAADSAVLLMSTVQGAVADPQVFLAVHMLSGFGSEQRYLLCSSEAR